MKNIIILCTIIFCSIILSTACNKPEKIKTSDVKMDLKSISDSISQLIWNFHHDGDSTALELALSLSDQAIALDSLDPLNKDQFYILYTRCQMLAMLGRKKEAFLLSEKILSKDEDNVDRLMYFGQKYNLKGQKDSSQIYFNKALMRCDELLADKFSPDVVLNKVGIYIYQKKYKEALKILDQSLLEHPQDTILEPFREGFDEYYKISSVYFDDIKL